MAQYGSVTQSHVAGVSTKTLAELREGAKKTWGLRALGVAAFAVTLIPLVGMGLSYLVERQKNSGEARNQKEVLAKYYRDQVAAQLGIDPSSVNSHDLELAARVNPQIQQAIAKVEQEKKDANRSSAMANGAAAAAGGIFLPTAGMAIKVGTEIGAAVVGGAASTLFEKEVLHTQDVVEYLDGKMKQGQQLSAYDLVLLRISKDEQWQASFKKKHSKPFHKMNQAEQQAAMSTMPEMLMGVEKQVYALNKGLISLQSVAVGDAQPVGGFSDAVGRRGTPQSYTAALAAERAAPADLAQARY